MLYTYTVPYIILFIYSYIHYTYAILYYTGIDSITTSLALVIAISIFQHYFINSNWRTTQYITSAFTSILGLQWLLVFYNVFGLRNGWFTIFIDTNLTLSSGITQVYIGVYTIWACILYIGVYFVGF